MESQLILELIWQTLIIILGVLIMIDDRRQS